ncbi:hypothetical protein RHS04_05077, partial [Rhizoctonia solani]
MITKYLYSLLALGTLCRAWRASFSEATQCGTTTVTWSAATAESIGPPFVVRVAPFGLAPLILDVPTSAWSDSSRAGSYSFTVPWPEGTRFVSAMDDGFGFGTGGISGIQTVKSSSDSSCINSTITQPSQIFSIRGSFAQCSVVSMNWTEPATSQTRIAGLVPSGVAFQLDPPLTGSKSTTWDLNLEAGTAFVLIYSDGSGNNMTSQLLQSLDSTTTGCLASGSYPSATAPQTGVAEATATSSTTALPTGSSISESGSGNSRSNLGPILGAVFGTLALLGVLGLGVWAILRRRRRKRVTHQELAEGVDLDRKNTRENHGLDENHQNNGPRRPGSAAILPFVLPYNGAHQGASASDHSRKRAPQVVSRETADTRDSFHIYGTDTSASESVPGARSDVDDDPMFIQHEDAGTLIPPRTREVIELPPGYDQLPRPPPPPPAAPAPAPARVAHQPAGRAPISIRFLKRIYDSVTSTEVTSHPSDVRCDYCSFTFCFGYGYLWLFPPRFDPELVTVACDEYVPILRCTATDLAAGHAYVIRTRWLLLRMVSSDLEYLARGGQMGLGIAYVGAVRAKLPVYIYDRSSDQIKKSLALMDKLLDKEVSKGKMESTEAKEARDRVAIVGEEGLKGFRDLDMVVEAASENVALKLSLFKSLAQELRPDAILASNTSSISITKIAAAAIADGVSPSSEQGKQSAGRVVGLHFFNPVPVMKLVELISGLQTTPETLDRARSFAEACGKVVTVSKDVPGFVSNALLMPFINEAIMCLEKGVATRDDIDTTLKLGMNHPMGPLTLVSSIGLDTCLAIQRVLYEGTGDSKYRPSILLERMVDAGWLGKKSGKGFYDYNQSMSQAVRAMDFLSSRYQTFLSNAQPATQTADSTIHRLADRLDPTVALPDRRAAVLSLKGLARDEKYKSEIGQVAFDRLVEVVLLGGDAEADAESGKAVLETLGLLCEVVPDEHGKVSKGDVGYRHTDMLLSKPEPLRKLFGLLGQTSFYIRFSSLQLLSQIVQNRAQAVQKHLIDYPDGLPAVIAILDEKREVIRNEALLLLQSLAHQNADIQKILAFSGAFEKLLDIVAAEGGVEGGVVVQDCLAVVDAMLRFNSSNQNYFRELSLPPRIPPLLLYPSPPPPLNVPAPQEFALQFWDAQKLANAGMLVGIISLLTGSKTKSVEPSLRPLEAAGIFRCLIELGLSSNAPAPLKTQALLALPSRPNLTVHITPYLPVPGSNGEEWDRLPEQEALGALVGVALDGEYGGVLAATEDDVDVGLGKEELELRWAAASVFDNLVSNDQTARLALAASLAPPPPPPPRDPAQPMVPLDPPTPGQHLLSALVDFPASGRIGRRVATKIQLACALLSSLVRGSEKAKGVARMVVPGENKPVAGADADADSDDSPRLVSVLIGNVHLALRERGQNNRRAWDRVIVSLLMVLSNWMWDSPSSVRDFFGEGGGLQVVGLACFTIELARADRAVVDGAYHSNNRATLYPILHSRIGADVFIARMARVREDERFKAVGPDSPVIPAGLGLEDEPQPEEDGEVVGGDVWLDWGFVEFWKGNAYTIQRAIAVDPDAAASNA